jgi:hypothetical protein
MEFLRDIFKRAQHGMAASTWFGIPAPVQTEMERLGWKFHSSGGLTPFGGWSHTSIYTPQNRVLNGEHPEDFERYAKLRRQLADKFYPVP